MLDLSPAVANLLLKMGGEQNEMGSMSLVPFHKRKETAIALIAAAATFPDLCEHCKALSPESPATDTRTESTLRSHSTKFPKSGQPETALGHYQLSSQGEIDGGQRPVPSSNVSSHSTHKTGQMKNNTPGSNSFKPTQPFHLASNVVRDTSATNRVHSPPLVESKRTDDEDSDSGDSRITINDSEDDEQQQQHRDSDQKYQSTSVVNAVPPSCSLPVKHPSSPSTVAKETDMQVAASQLIQVLGVHDYVQANRLLEDLQGNVQKKLSLKSLERDFLLEIVGSYATTDELAQTTKKFVQTGRVNHATLITICQKLHIAVSNQSDEELRYLISTYAGEAAMI
jgi:hypothetical protein